MSDEIATEDDAEAGDFEIDTFAQHDGDDDDDLDEGRKKSALAATQERQDLEAQTRSQEQHRAREGPDNQVMFSLGDEEEGPTPRTATMRPHGSDAEREGLMSGKDDDEDDVKKRD